MRALQICVVLLTLVLPLEAQVSGRVTGSVVDANGSAVPEAAVSLFFSGGKTPVLATATTSSGLFTLTGIRPDSYDLTVQGSGFQKYTLQGLKVDAALETSLPPISLVLETVTLKVEVTASAPTVQTANAEVGTIITNEQVRRLPVLDRSALALIQTQAGVNNSGGAISING